MATEILQIRLEDTGGAEVRSSLNRTGNTLDSLKARVTGVTSVLGGYRAALAGIVTGAAANFIKSQLASIDELGKWADQVNANIGVIGEYRQVTALAGVDFDTFRKAIDTSTVRIQKAAEGTGLAKNALAELGIPIQDIINLKADEQFELIARAMQGVDSDTRKLKLTTDIFGRSNAEVVRLLNQGTEALQEQREAASDMGLTLTEEGVTAAAEFNDKLQLLTDTFTALFQAIVVLIADPLSKLIGWIIDGITWISRIIGAIRDWISENVFLKDAVAETGREVTDSNERFKDFSLSLDDYTEAASGATTATNSLKKAQEEELEVLELAEAPRIETVNLMRDQATQALLLEERLESQRIKELELAKATREAAEATREKLNAVTGLVAASASLLGIATPDQLGAILSIGSNIGTLFGVSADQLAQLGAFASTGAVGGALVGGGGAGAGIGGAIGGVAGAALFSSNPILGVIAGSLLGGLGGGFFDSSNQPSVTFATGPGGSGSPFRGRIGQRTFVSEGLLGQVAVGARDGGNLTDELIQFADLLSGLDDIIGSFIQEDQSRLDAARIAAQSVSNETNAENFNAAENIRIRFQTIFDSIGGIESELFDAFSPSGEFVPQVVSAISVLRELGSTAQTVAREWDETDDAFLQAVFSLQFLNDAVTQQDPIGKIREQLELLNLSVEQQQQRQVDAIFQLTSAYDGSIAATNQMAGSISQLEQITANVIRGIDLARESTQRATEGTIQRIRQSGLTPQQIFRENFAEAQRIRAQIESGAFQSSDSLTKAINNINQLVSQGFFGLSEEERGIERERQIEFLEEAQEASNRQFEAQERRATEQHEAALKASRESLRAAASIGNAAGQLFIAAEELSEAAEGLSNG